MFSFRTAAFLELVKRYCGVFYFFWRRRGGLKTDLYREHEAEFLPAALALQEKPVSPTVVLTARLFLLLAFVLTGWSLFGRVDIVVKSLGKVIPTGHVRTVASIDTASVRAIHVREGQVVKAGDLLIELDSSGSDAERNKALVSRNQEILNVVRLESFISTVRNGRTTKWPALRELQRMDSTITAEQSEAERLHFEGVYRDFLAKKQRLDEIISHISDSLPLVARTAADYAELLKTHDIAEHAWLDKERARLEMQGQLADARNQRDALQSETLRLAYDQLAEARKMAAVEKQDAIRSGSHSALLRLAAPIDGVVQQLTVHTVGGVIQAAQPLMEIVPKDDMIEVEATIENKDIGFIEEGQSAQVKVDTFDYTKYGTVGATVTHVSRDAVQDEKRGLLYIAQITLDKKTMDIDGKRAALSPGMAVSVDIKTGSRRIIEYFLSPLQQHGRESLRER
jgi:hemolysin D